MNTRLVCAELVCWLMPRLRKIMQPSAAAMVRASISICAGLEIGHPRGPVEIVAAVEYEVAPFAPADDPALAEFLVVQVVLEQVVDDAEAERHVGAGADRQPGVGLGRGGGQARIDDDHARAVARRQSLTMPKLTGRVSAWLSPM